MTETPSRSGLENAIIKERGQWPSLTRIPPGLSSERFVPLVPDSDPVTGTDLLSVLTQSSRPGNDPAGHTGTTVTVSQAAAQ